ncbi:hypothetical protein ACROYT_G019026 [Oculina patagonica]
MQRRFITTLLVLGFILYLQCITSTEAVHSAWPHHKRRRSGKRTLKNLEETQVFVEPTIEPLTLGQLCQDPDSFGCETED